MSAAATQGKAAALSVDTQTVKRIQTEQGNLGVNNAVQNVRNALIREKTEYCNRFLVKYNTDIAQEDIQQAVEQAYQICLDEKIVSHQQMRDPLTPQESAFVFRSKPDISEEAPPTLFSDSKGGYRIVLPESIDPECFVQKLLTFRRGQIQYLQPDFKLSLAAIENSEPAIDSQNTEDAVNERAVSPIKEIIQNGQQPQVVELTDEDVIVAVIDTGIDPQHPAYRTVCKDGWDFVHNQPLAYDPAVEMDQLHGTHISGLIAQQAPAAQLLPLKCFEQGNAYTSDIIDTIHYAETHGARIVNCSWVTDQENPALKEAIEQSQMLFVCAAGNTGKNLDEVPVYPACYDLENIVAVTSVDLFCIC